MKKVFKLSELDLAIKLLENITLNFDKKKKKFLEKLAELGIEIATIKFQNAQYDGDNDVSVESKWINDNKIQIIAKGKSVAFIEFGTGITYTEQHPLADQMGAIRGSYGKGRGKNKAWGYFGEKGTNGKVIRTTRDGKEVVLTHGNPPARAMYEANKTIKMQIFKIAEEVFIND